MGRRTTNLFLTSLGAAGQVLAVTFVLVCAVWSSQVQAHPGHAHSGPAAQDAVATSTPSPQSPAISESSVHDYAPRADLGSDDAERMHHAMSEWASTTTPMVMPSRESIGPTAQANAQPGPSNALCPCGAGCGQCCSMSCCCALPAEAARSHATSSSSNALVIPAAHQVTGTDVDPLPRPPNSRHHA